MFQAVIRVTLVVVVVVVVVVVAVGISLDIVTWRQHVKLASTFHKHPPVSYRSRGERRVSILGFRKIPVQGKVR